MTVGMPRIASAARGSMIARLSSLRIWLAFGEIYLHQFLPILAHIIPPHLLDAGRLESLPRN